jgi:predicted oxidoreductase (fatty acid repression mutant protein)
MPESIGAGKSAKVSALGIDAIALWMLGFPDTAISSAEEGVRVAQESRNSYDSAFALINLHIVTLFRREYAKAREVAEHALRIIEEKHFEWLRTSIVWSLYACQVLGAERTGIDQVKTAFDAYFASEAKLYRPMNCTVLAECWGVLNQPALGLSMIDQAVSGTLETDQRMAEPETWRVKGELVLRLPSENLGPKGLDSHAEEAEGCFRKAIATARARKSKTWELRATVSLARLLQRSQKTAEVRESLAEVYGWFTEGLETPDLKQAQILLAQLST